MCTRSRNSRLNTVGLQGCPKSPKSLLRRRKREVKMAENVEYLLEKWELPIEEVWSSRKSLFRVCSLKYSSSSSSSPIACRFSRPNLGLTIGRTHFELDTAERMKPLRRRRVLNFFISSTVSARCFLFAYFSRSFFKGLHLVYKFIYWLICVVLYSYPRMIERFFYRYSVIWVDD